MQDETLRSDDDNNSTKPQSSKAEATHRYVEVGNDLLAKPDALAQLLLIRGMPSTVVFCNSPSEADMVEVILRKKTISCSKLIGNVPHQRLIEEVSKVHNGQTTALIITDVAAQDLEVEGFGVVVNYGIHEDPEIYLHRITGYETAASLKEVISLVSPLDFGNFHYLRKVVTLDFEKEELPTDAALAKAQSEILFSSALEGKHLEDEATQSLQAALLEHENRDKIISLLLYNTLHVIPKLEDEVQNARDNRGRRGGRGDRDRDNRDNRDSRDSRDSRGGDSRDRGGRGRRSDQGDDRSNRREEREDLPPPKKDTRIYIGHGSEHGFDADAFTKLVTEAGFTAEDTVKRISVRELYSFADVPEEATEEVLQKLEGASFGDTDLFIRKATLINVPREESAGSSNEDSEDAQHDSEADSSEEE